MHLANGRMVFQLKEHFASEHEARARVTEFLDTWDLWSYLHGRQPITVACVQADLVDRTRISTGTAMDQPVVSIVARLGHVGSPITSQTLADYPEPPLRFTRSVLVDDLWRRFDAYKHGREPLLLMAYAVYTIIIEEYGGEAPTAQVLGISRKILKEISLLVSTRGDRLSLRKLAPRSTLIPQSDYEVTRLEAALLLLMRRLGEREYSPDAELPRLTLADLPRAARQTGTSPDTKV